MMTMNKVMLWVVTAAAVTFAFFPHYVGAFLQGPSNSAFEGETVESVVAIKGMTCEGCSAIAAKAIGDVPGVVSVAVDFKAGQAVILTEKGRSVPRDAILSALEISGYTGTFDETRTATRTPTESRDTGDKTATTPSDASSPGASKASTCTLSVSGMTRQGYARTVRSALVDLPGVKSGVVNLKKREAVIRYDRKTVDPIRLADATTKAGFPSRVKETKSKQSQEIQ